MGIKLVTDILDEIRIIGQFKKIVFLERFEEQTLSIANRFNVSLGQLKRWNDIDIKKYLQPGDMLTLYVDVANAP